MSKRSSIADQLIDTLQLSPYQWRSLSKKLDQLSPDFCDKRRYERISYRKLAQIVVAIKPPEGEWAKFIVRSHNLSRGGIGFLHGCYLHPGCQCRIILKNSQGQAVCINGVVKRCEFLEAKAHDIGVEFDQEININDYVSGEAGHTDASL